MRQIVRSSHDSIQRQVQIMFESGGGLEMVRRQEMESQEEIYKEYGEWGGGEGGDVQIVEETTERL